jgi:hypothetical protein
MILIKRKGIVVEKGEGGNCSAALGNQLQHCAAFWWKYS